jgi:hypothetical protein
MPLMFVQPMVKVEAGDYLTDIVSNAILQNISNWELCLDAFFRPQVQDGHHHFHCEHLTQGVSPYLFSCDGPFSSPSREEWMGIYWFQPIDPNIVSNDVIEAALVKKTSGAIHDFHAECKADFESAFHDDIIRLSIPSKENIFSNPLQYTPSTIQAAVLNVSVNISDTFGSIKTNFQKEYLPIVSTSNSGSSNHARDVEYYYLDHIMSQLKSIPFCRSREKYEDFHHETAAVSTSSIISASIVHASAMKPSLTRVLILGDSHSATFYYAAAFSAHYSSSSSSSSSSEKSFIQCADSNYHTCPVAAGSAYGLKKLNSSTMVRKKFSSCLNQHGKQANYVAMIIGNNDLMFLPRLRNVTVLDQIKTSISSLFEYVDEVLIKERGFKMNQVFSM